MTLRDKLIGAWFLQSYIEYPVDGSSPSYPLGEDAKGLIIYSPDGFMSSQLMRTGRPAFASGDWFRGTPQDYEQAGSYIAYSGPFDVDEETGTLTHSMFVSFFPNWLGQTQIRLADLVGDILHLGPKVPIQSAGKSVMSKLQWRRAVTR